MSKHESINGISTTRPLKSPSQKTSRSVPTAPTRVAESAFAKAQARLVNEARQKGAWTRTSRLAVFQWTALTVGLFATGYLINGLVNDYRTESRRKQAVNELIAASEVPLVKANGQASLQADNVAETSKMQSPGAAVPASSRVPLMDQSSTLRQIVILEERKTALLRQKKACEDKIEAFREEVRQRDEKAVVQAQQRRSHNT